MLVLFSHVAAFSVLFVAAVWDLYTTEVPDVLMAAGVTAGIALHGYLAFSSGTLQPLVWSLGAGMVYSVYGWGMYFMGMWGGADAFAMSVLGFAAPYSLSGMGIMHGVNLFLNVMIAGFIYTIGYALYRAWREDSVMEDTVERLKEDEFRISAEILLSAGFSGILIYTGFSGFRLFLLLVGMILLYRFLKVLEGKAMTREVEVDDLEGGEVVARGLEVDRAKDRNIIGKAVDSLDSHVSLAFLKPLGERYGYSEVVGITEEEIGRLAEQDVEKVKVKQGVRFIPVYPVALLITDVLGGGLSWILFLSL